MAKSPTNSASKTAPKKYQPKDAPKLNTSLNTRVSSATRSKLDAHARRTGRPVAHHVEIALKKHLRGKWAR